MPARRRIPLNRSTSGVRAPPAAFSSRRPCPQRADDPSGGRRSDGGKDAEGRVRNGRPTILPRPDGKRPVRPPRIPARRRRNGAPKRSSVTQKHRTSLPADELRIARDIGSADDRLPVLARHAAERLPPRRRSRIPSSGRHETTDGPGSAQSGNIAIFILRNRLCSVQIAARCGIGEVVSPEEALSGKSTGTPAIAARLPHTSARHRHVSTCRPPEGGASEAGRIGPDDNSAGSPPADRPVPHSQAEQTLLSASVTFRDTTDVPSVLSPNTGFRRQANGAPVLRPERTKVVDPRRGHCPTRHGFDQKRRTPAVVSVRPAVRAPFQTERKKQIEAARSVSSTAVEVPSEHAYSAASCNLEWQTTKTRQANESFAAASGEPLIRGKIRKLYRSKRGCLKFVRQPLFDREVVPPGNEFYF